MPLLAEINETAFSDLAEVTVLGKDSFIKNEKTGTYFLAMDGAEAGKLALPLQAELKKTTENNAKLLDEKIKTAAKVTAYEKLGKTPEEIEEILKTGKTPASEELERKHNLQIESLKTEHQRALDVVSQERDTFKTDALATSQELADTIKQRTIAQLRTEFGVSKGGEDWFLNRIQVVKDPATGKYVEQVIENGEVAYKGMALKTPRQLAEEARADKELSNIFNSGYVNGTGADPDQKPANYSGNVIRSGDTAAIGANLADVASGKMRVVG